MSSVQVFKYFLRAQIERIRDTRAGILMLRALFRVHIPVDSFCASTFFQKYKNKSWIEEMTLNGTTDCLIPVEICNRVFSGQVLPFVEDLESSQNATKAAKPKYVNLICTFVFT